MWLSELATVLNSRLRELVIPLIVLGLTRSPLVTSLVMLSQQLGTIIFAIPIGTWVESKNKVRVATICNLFYAVCIFLLTFFIASEQYNSLLVAILLFVMGIVALISRTAFSTMIPNVTGRDKLVEAHTGLEAADAFSTFVGPTIGGLLLAYSGESVTLFICGLLSIISMFFISRVQYTEKVKYTETSNLKIKRKRFIQQTSDGLRYIFSTPQQIVCILVISSLSFSTVFIMLTVIFHARITLNLSEGLIGIALSCAGVGNMAGIIIMKWFKNVNWLLFLIVLLTVSASGILLIALFKNYLFLCIGLLVFDGALSMAFIVQAAVQQGVTPDELLSRVKSATYVISGIFSVLGTFLAGVIPEYWSSEIALLVGFLLLTGPAIYIIKYHSLSDKLSHVKPRL